MARLKRFKNKNNSNQTNSILNYVKIKKEINANSSSIAPRSVVSSIQNQQDQNKHRTYEFESKKWQTNVKFETIRDLNKEMKKFIQQRFGKLEYETKSIRELQRKDILFMTKLREAFELRGSRTVKCEQIWPRVQNSNRTRRYHLQKKFKH